MKQVWIRWRPKATVVIGGIALKNPSRHKVELLAFVEDDAVIERAPLGKPRIRLDIELPEG